MLRYEYGKSIRENTTLKIGGPAFCWLEPENFDDILESIDISQDKKKKLVVLGGGSNIIADDNGFDGIIIKLGKRFNYIEKEGEDLVRVGAGTPINSLVGKCIEWGFSGCEFLSGIPGAVGGAIAMNAGVRDLGDTNISREIKDILLSVDILDIKNKERRNIKRDDIPFKYRSCGLEDVIFIEAVVKLKQEDKDVIENKTKAFIDKRAWISKLKFPSAGSIFKNPGSDNPAGRLIEECGLKGTKIGGAEISLFHANFIVNTGGATSKDIFQLMDLAREKVKNRFGIELEPELKILR
ncbi:MAG: UDP-N-acetylmuramate dehydrogenase [Candidatus Omnitrophota bacterium]